MSKGNLNVEHVDRRGINKPTSIPVNGRLIWSLALQFHDGQIYDSQLFLAQNTQSLFIISYGDFSMANIRMPILPFHIDQMNRFIRILFRLDSIDLFRNNRIAFILSI